MLEHFVPFRPRHFRPPFRRILQRPKLIRRKHCVCPLQAAERSAAQERALSQDRLKQELEKEQVVSWPLAFLSPALLTPSSIPPLNSPAVVLFYQCIAFATSTKMFRVPRL